VPCSGLRERAQGVSERGRASNSSSRWRARTEGGVCLSTTAKVALDRAAEGEGEGDEVDAL
jgi:hypothetical protein